MLEKKNILAIIGSASKNSANKKLMYNFSKLTSDYFEVTIYNDLHSLPHFDPESTDNPPLQAKSLQDQIFSADGVVICTPEYIFSIPSGLKNALEWCVSTTIFSEKPVGLITASADGEKAHEEIKLIMKTLMANFTEKTTLLLSGIKGKLDTAGNISDKKTMDSYNAFIAEYKNHIFILDA